MVTKKTSTTTKKHTVAAKTRSKKAVPSKEITYQSFKVATDFPVFFQPRLTKQTVYWSILLLVIIVLQLMIIATNVNATITFDSIQY